MYTISLNDAGDLDFTNRHGKVITGRDKLIQQLTIWISEELHIDRFHYNYGSRLESMIGSPMHQEALDNAVDEVRRVVVAYMSMITPLFEEHPENYSKEEIPAQLLYIDGAFEGMDTIRVKLTLRTLANSAVDMEYTV